MVPFSNGRRKGANPSSRVIVFSSLESQTFFVDQLCCFKLGISISSLKTCIPSDRSHPYRKDRWRLHFIFVLIQVERETVMTVNSQQRCQKLDMTKLQVYNIVSSNKVISQVSFSRGLDKTSTKIIVNLQLFGKSIKLENWD